MGIDEIIDTLKAMHHALEFYANGLNYESARGHIVVLDDAGEQARTALSKLEQLSEHVQQHRPTSAKHSEASAAAAGAPQGS